MLGKRSRSDINADPDAVQIKSRTDNRPIVTSMWREGRFCDGVVVCEGHHFHVHRVVLAASSDFFAAAFESGCAEGCGAPVCLAEVPKQAFEAVAEFAYTGECILSESSLLPMLDVASLLQMRTLTAHISDALVECLKPSNFMGVWDVAQRLSLPRLASMAKARASSDVKQISTFARSTELASLPAEIIERITGPASAQTRTKRLQFLMIRDGSLQSTKIELVQKALKPLGLCDDASFYIDSSARVNVKFVAPAYGCGGPEFLQIDFPDLKSSTGRIPTGVAEGYPKEVRMFPDGPTFQYYKVNTVSISDSVTKELHMLTAGPILPCWMQLKPMRIRRVYIRIADEELAENDAAFKAARDAQDVAKRVFDATELSSDARAEAAQVFRQARAARIAADREARARLGEVDFYGVSVAECNVPKF